MNNQLMIKEDGDFLPNPRTMREAIDLANVIIESGFAPASYKKPSQIIVAIQYGKELGLKPIHSLHNIAVINGKPSIYGDGLLAICRKSPEFEDFKETKEEGKAICYVKRKGQSPVIREFSLEDAKKACLLNKTGPWSTYPERMLQMRARSWALRDAFADLLQGLIQAEEAQDIPVKNERINYYSDSNNVIDSDPVEIKKEFVEVRGEEEIFDLEAKLQALAECKDLNALKDLSSQYWKQAKSLQPAECVKARNKITQKKDEMKKLLEENLEPENANGTTVQNS